MLSDDLFYACTLEYTFDTDQSIVQNEDEDSLNNQELSALDINEDYTENWEDEDESDVEDESTTPSIQETADECCNKKADDISVWIIGFLMKLQKRHVLSDSALDSLIKFIYALLVVLGIFSSFILAISKAFPSSLYKLRRTVLSNEQFTKFVVCTKCNSLYFSHDCVSQNGNQPESRKCTYNEFPRNQRNVCGQILMKTVQYSSGRTSLYPFKVFCYRDLKFSLQSLLLQPKFVSNCLLWAHDKACNLFKDIYDGRIWRSFVDNGFFSSDYCYGLMLNLDWYQPFEHSIFSVGVIYLAVMNLPRNIRFKQENIILLGIIPGPSEPKHNINSFLRPLVKELLDFYDGVDMSVVTHSGVCVNKVKCALLCVTCDTPAGRKACGYLGHNAALGCCKCLKKFSGSVGKMNYSGFNRSSWVVRSLLYHKRSVAEIKQQINKSRKAEK